MMTLTKEALADMVLLVATAHKVAPKSRIVADAYIVEYKAVRRNINLEEGADDRIVAAIRALDWLIKGVEDEEY